MNEIYDPLRGCYVKALPEEIVRQKILHKLQHELSYPKGLISVEAHLAHLPYISEENIQGFKRRADILCFARNIHPNYPLYPIVLIECKAVPITTAVFSQVEGYNALVKAYFFCVANADVMYTCWLDKHTKKRHKVSYLPSYKEVLKAIHG